MLETLGLDWRLSTTEIDSLKAVTPEQVRTVAQRYLVDENLTVATLVPLPMDKRQPGQPAVPEAVAAVKHGWVLLVLLLAGGLGRRPFGRVLAHQPRCQGDVRACTRTADGRRAGRRRRRQCTRWRVARACRDSPMRCSAGAGEWDAGAMALRLESAGSSSAAVRCVTAWISVRSLTDADVLAVALESAQAVLAVRVSTRTRSSGCASSCRSDCATACSRPGRVAARRFYRIAVRRPSVRP